MLLEENISVIHMIAFLYRKQSTYLNDKLKEYGLNAGLYPVLITIYKNEDLMQNEIAKRIGLSKSTMTRNLKKLEEKGLIRRYKVKQKSHVKVTEKGKEISEKIINYDKQWDDQLKEISMDDYEKLKKILEKYTLTLM